MIQVGCCIACGGFDCVYPRVIRQADALWRGGEGEIQTAAQLVKRSNTTFTSSAYPEVKIGQQSLVAVAGPPGSGKSMFCLKWLDGVTGPVLYFSVEESLSESLVQKLKWLEIARSDFHIAGGVSIETFDEAVETRQPRAVVVDSLTVSTVKVTDLRRAALHHRVPILFTMHVNKTGAPAGDLRIIHEADVVIEVSERGWRIGKSRFCGVVDGRV